ncbi:hypothetical protein [Rhizobium sp. NFR07]|uniref:hypothetical protein n=1 Tax=Rhizobium sp. NFR07 TaxID=1566262 RepID=UPI001160D7E3|nr:hypothetical protein [Rhizobium sp. NFR07]
MATINSFERRWQSGAHGEAGGAAMWKEILTIMLDALRLATLQSTQPEKGALRGKEQQDRR